MQNLLKTEKISPWLYFYAKFQAILMFNRIFLVLTKNKINLYEILVIN
jgi:hypothetical protein